MAPRFYSSPYKNAAAQIGKVDLVNLLGAASPLTSFVPLQRDAWWSELPVSTSAASDSSDLIKTCSEYWLAQGSASGGP